MIFHPLPVEKFPVSVIGVIERPIEGSKPGRIRYGGTTWFAKSGISNLNVDFFAGQIVEVYARQGNTLLILPSAEQILLA